MSLAYIKRSSRACPTCRRSIAWTTTEAGKRMAVDIAPSVQSRIAVRVDGAGTIRSRTLTDDFPLMPLEQLLMPHVASCRARRPHRGGPVDVPENVVLVDFRAGRRTR